MGILVLVFWVVIGVVCVLGHASHVVIGLLVLCALVTYLAMLRPCVGLTDEELVYRQMLSELRIPLTQIDEVRVTRFFEVTAAGRRHISPAVTRPRPRRNLRDLKGFASPRTASAGEVYADMVVETTRTRIADARLRTRPDTTPPRIRRNWARPEIVGAVAAIILFLVIVAL